MTLRRKPRHKTCTTCDEHTDAICDHLNEHPPRTIAKARDAIEALTGVRRGLTQVGEYLKRIGFKRLKAGSLPAKADPDKQAEFKKAARSPPEAG